MFLGRAPAAVISGVALFSNAAGVLPAGRTYPVVSEPAAGKSNSFPARMRSAMPFDSSR